MDVAKGHVVELRTGEHRKRNAEAAAHRQVALSPKDGVFDHQMAEQDRGYRRVEAAHLRFEGQFHPLDQGEIDLLGLLPRISSRVSSVERFTHGKLNTCTGPERVAIG